MLKLPQVHTYPFEKMGKEFLGLRALLESKYEVVPELAMNMSCIL